MNPEIYLLKLHIAELETENEKLKQLVKPKVPLPPTQGDSSVKEYFKMFEFYITCLGVSSNSEFAREQFIKGLSAKSKANISVTSEALPYIDYLVTYLSGEDA